MINPPAARAYGRPMAVHVVPLPRAAQIEYVGSDGSLAGGHAFAVEMTDGDEDCASAWIIKPEGTGTRPGDVHRVYPSSITRFGWR
jgi:hypothetical protein